MSIEYVDIKSLFENELEKGIDMKIEKRKVTGVFSKGACHFCDKGELSLSKTNLVYPYEEIIVLYGGIIEIRFCKECFNKMKELNFDDITLVENDFKTNSIEI